ncbi:MAG: hypothetical protein BWY31_03045 [Lentisphaerae bacterium ADurb.Bin242]|nr:MAG: hypothetical protein BWY31_03045 [Lentisphaerae bacterium ADurb.Bin242]
MQISDHFAWQCLNPETGHYFFGYYDRNPWDKNNARHLALRVEQCERLPECGETADLGYVTPDGNEFVKLTETRTWCHQQGCMSLWLKHHPNCFVYNDYDPASAGVIARIFEPGKGIMGQYERPIFSISPDGRWASSLNFARIPRRGYSYADAVLPAEQRHPDPDRDGVFLLDLHTGKPHLLASYRQMVERHPVPYELDDMYWWLNTVIFNCDSSKVLFSFRYCRDPYHPGQPMWKTFMYTVNLDGTGLACTLPEVYWTGMISHPIWGRTPNEVLIDANWRGKGHEYVVFDDRIRPLRAERISQGQGPMGHLVFSPDGEWMLADTYPVDGIQTLALVKVSTGECRTLGRFRHVQPPGTIGDLRCDLHPRWSADGTLITVDSIHSGKRGIYMLRFNDSVKF